MGFRPGRLFATLSGLGEFAGGLGLAVGFLTPLAAAGIIATMLVAIWTVHLPKGFFVSAGGYEYNLLVIAGALGVAFAGPGPISIDAALGLPFAGSTWGLVALALGAVGATGTLLSRSHAPQVAAKTA
jgi:putative oxidoreductase